MEPISEQFPLTSGILSFHGVRTEHGKPKDKLRKGIREVEADVKREAEMMDYETLAKQISM